MSEKTDIPVIDLDAEDWKQIQQAASESEWMPPQYMRNDWVSDVCRFLRHRPSKAMTDDDLSEPLLKVVCAAIRHKETDLVIAGVRHNDDVMVDLMLETRTAVRDGGRIVCDKFESGFLTNKGEFLDRQQSWIIAARANQIRPRHGQVPGTLHSEDLY